MPRTLRVLLLLPIVLLAGCPFESARPVRLRITHLVVPDTLASGASLHIDFNVESGGCVRFDRIDVERTESRVTLTGWGLDSSGPTTACTMDLRYNALVLNLERPLSDPFTVVAREPDGTTLERVVKVLPTVF